MDDGLIQLLVIGFFVIVSMMDGAARKRRKEAQRMGRPSEPAGIAGSNRIPETARPPGDDAESSEALVPQDLWNEIAALARGEEPAPRAGRGSLRGPEAARDSEPDGEPWVGPGEALSEASAPGAELEERDSWEVDWSPGLDTPAATPSPPTDLQSGYLHPDQAVTHEEHAQLFPLERPLPVEPPHEFVPHAPQPPRQPSEEPGRTGRSRSLLSSFRRGSRRSLRDAIVLAEVLNLPVVLRDSDRQLPGGE